MISVQVSLDLRLAGAVPPAPVSRLSSSVAFGKTPGAGKGGALVPPAGATSAVQLGEASPVASPSLHIKKQYLVEQCHRVEGMFNVDCARCGDGQTFGSHTMADYIRTHTCT